MADLSGFDLTVRPAPLSTPSVFDGYLMRSKLEVKWAQHLTACDIGWSYEPHSFRLRRGVGYMPDFYLGHGFYVEVKHDGGDFHKPRELVRKYQNLKVILAEGEPADQPYECVTADGSRFVRFVRKAA